MSFTDILKKSLTLGAIGLGVAVTAAVLWAVSGYESSPPVTLTNTSSCDSGFAINRTAPNSGMVWVPGGPFSMGAEFAYFEEGPVFQNSVDGFWMDTHEVTNAQFSEFVNETGYLTLAERGSNDPNIPAEQQIPGSAVFTPLMEDGNLVDPREGWWHYIAGANWREPTGPGSSIEGKEQHPVVHLAYEDALAYADWTGHELPTEAQFEFAAQSSVRRDGEGNYQSNTWQGFFPIENNGNDGFIDSSPVGCYTANEYGLYDLIGNVWEWTSSPFYDSHNFSAKEEFPEGYDSTQPGEAVAVIKGGSFLCAPNYCMRYRPEARQGQSKGLGTSHIGFRTVLNSPQ